MMFVPIICVWFSLSKIWIWFQYFLTTNLYYLKPEYKIQEKVTMGDKYCQWWNSNSVTEYFAS